MGAEDPSSGEGSFGVVVVDQHEACSFSELQIEGRAQLLRGRRLEHERVRESHTAC